MASKLASNLATNLNASSEQLRASLNSYGSANSGGLHAGQFMAASFLLAVLVPCFAYRSPLRYGILLLQITATVQAYLAPPPPLPSTPELYTWGVLLGNLTFRYLDRLYLHVPEKTFHRVSGGKDGKKEDAAELGFLRKFLWSLELFVVTRGVGWDWRVGGIPRMGPALLRSRGRFLLNRLLKWVGMYAALYVTGLACGMVLDGFKGVKDEETREWLVRVSGNQVFLYFFIMLASAPTIYSHFAFMMHPVSLVCVGLGIGPPGWEEQGAWPSNFGWIGESWSIRRFWGIAWHQQLRRITGTPGAELLSQAPLVLQTSKHPLIRLFRRYYLVFASFFFSALIHSVGTYIVTRAQGLPLSDGAEFKFFLLHGLALLVEDLVCYVLGVNDQDKSRPPTRLRVGVGYAVTLAWWTYSRVALKAIPLAEAHGLRDERGMLWAALGHTKEWTKMPGNFVEWGGEAAGKRWAAS